MISIIIPAILILTAICIKLCIDVIGLLIFVRKDKELIQTAQSIREKLSIHKGTVLVNEEFRKLKNKFVDTILICSYMIHIILLIVKH
jgi:hypothetical protein